MGFFEKLLSAVPPKKERSRTPLYQFVLTHIQNDLYESPYEVIKRLPKAAKKKIIQDICHVSEIIWQAPDRVLANREGLLESMLHQVEYEIFMVEPGHELCDFDGISGALKDYLPEFVQKRIDTGEFNWKRKSTPTKDEAYRLVRGNWLRANQYCKIFNGIRHYLQDYHTNLERDWFFPLQCASAAFAEYHFRKETGLTQVIDGSRALQYGAFLEIVSRGHKDPLEEWEKTYNEIFPQQSFHPKRRREMGR
ncbi:MAG TPA: hypothetical protein PKK23_13945 [Nitrospirales bacterium]|nr:hypothetical protein [Nitrospiraceae bacterium]HNP30145.1 hypothetical protein [Nitrospirales bacterium]